MQQCNNATMQYSTGLQHRLHGRPLTRFCCHYAVSCPPHPFFYSFAVNSAQQCPHTCTHAQSLACTHAHGDRLSPPFFNAQPLNTLAHACTLTAAVSAFNSSLLNAGPDTCMHSHTINRHPPAHHFKVSVAKAILVFCQWAQLCEVRAPNHIARPTTHPPK